MRFAWIRENKPDYVNAQQPFPHPASLARWAHNLAFWLFLAPLITPMSYGTGFVLFTGVLLFRVLANLWNNNGMPQTPEAFDRAPFRIPIQR